MSEIVLVAGCGDVGTRLARRLLARGDTVFALRRGVAPVADGIGWLQSLWRGKPLRDAEAATAARAHDLLATVGLADYATAPAAILSYGQRKLLAIAASMMARPRLVVLDEPVAGVNPTRIREIEVALSELNRAGETFLIVEHNVEFITNLCHRVIVLDQGKKLAEGTAAEIHTDPRVLEAYLGMTPEMAEAEMRGAA